MESVLENNAAQSAVPSSTEPLPDLVAQHLAKLQDIATKCDRENQLELIACTPVTLQEEGNLICAYCWEQDKCDGFERDYAPDEIFDTPAAAQTKLNQVQAEENRDHANVFDFCSELKLLAEQDRAKLAKFINKYHSKRVIAQFDYGVNVHCPSCKGKGIQKCPDCKGAGVIKCPNCNGRGKVTKTRTENYTKRTYSKAQHKTLSRDISRQVKYQVDCDKCRGSGKIKCNTCHGEGLVKCRSCSGSGLLKQSVVLKLNASLKFGLGQSSAVGYDFAKLQQVLNNAGLKKVRDLAQLKLDFDASHFDQEQCLIPYNMSADLLLIEYRCSGQNFVDVLMAGDGTVVQAAPFVDAVFASYVALLEEAAARKFANVTTQIDKLKSSDLIGACLQAKLNHSADESSAILKKGTEDHISSDLRKKINSLFQDWQELDERRMRLKRNLKIGAGALLVIAAAGAFAWLKLSGQL